MTRRPPRVFDVEEVTFDDGEVPERASPLRAAAAPADHAPEARAERRDVEEPIAPTPEPIAKGRRLTFAGVAGAGIAGLASLALSISLWAFIEDLFARTPWLGGLATALALLAAVGVAGMLGREWLALRRLKSVEALRRHADAAIAGDDRAAAKAVCAELIALYADRPQTARGRAALRGHLREVIDGRDLVGLAEREVLAALDREAVRHVVTSARRVAAVTALSPRALVDMAFVLFAAATMVRRIAEVYGGRTGTLGFLRVLRHAVAHLAVTGGMAAGDTFIGEIAGKGIAATLSKKLGEGIVNGLMTARLGLAAIDVLRPLPFHAVRRPRVNDIAAEVARIVPKET